MMLTKKTKIIAKREFMTVIKQRMFLIITFGIPIFFIFIGLLSFLHTFFLANELQQEIKVIGIIDQKGLIKSYDVKELINPELLGLKLNKKDKSALKPIINDIIKNLKVKKYDNFKKGIKDIKSNKLSLLYVIPKNYVETGTVKSYSKKAKIFTGGDYFLRWILRTALLEDIIDSKLLNRVQDPVALSHNLITEEGKIVQENDFKFWGALLIPYMASGIMMLMIFIPASYLLQSVSEEKENRIMEILLSSVTSEELLTGKMIGLGAAGLIQATVWLMFITIPFYFGTVVFQLSLVQILLYFMYIIFGFLLYGSMMAGLGSLGCDSKQSAQLAGIWSGVSVLPLLFMPIIVLHPNGLISRIMSFFPLTTSVTMMVRLSTNKLELIDIFITILIMIPTIYFVVKLSAKIFRTGILMYGKKASVREIIKWLRAS